MDSFLSIDDQVLMTRHICDEIQSESEQFYWQQMKSSPSVLSVLSNNMINRRLASGKLYIA